MPHPDQTPVGRTDLPPPRVGRRLHGFLDRARATPTGRLALKVTTGTLGGVVIAVGVLLLVLPGPGWGLIFAGLAILAVEFEWARRLLRFAKRHVQSWTHWVAGRSLPVRLAIGAVGMVFLAALVWGSVRLGTGIDLITVGRDLVTGG